MTQIRKKSIFLAYPWTSIMQEIYGTYLTKKLAQEWDIHNGPKLITDSSDEGAFKNFRSQNKQLFERFVKNIQVSDIFIADITDANPNVMIELGIAIKLNKNILILSGVSASKTPFDVSGVHVEFYKNKADMLKRVNNFLYLYKQIKNMEFNQPVTGFYYKLDSESFQSDEDSISKGIGSINTFRIHPIPIALPKMKDLKIKLKYKILRSNQPSDWFGFLLRSSESKGMHEPIFHGSILVNARSNGQTDITIYPGERIVNKGVTHIAHDGNDFRELTIILDGNYIKAESTKGSVEYSSLENSNIGEIYFTCYRAEVEIKDLEIIHTDTITDVSDTYS